MGLMLCNLLILSCKNPKTMLKYLTLCTIINKYTLIVVFNENYLYGLKGMIYYGKQM